MDELRVELKDGNVDIFRGEGYTDYDWKPNAFIVIKGEQWIAIYNWDEVKRINYSECIVVGDKDGDT